MQTYICNREGCRMAFKHPEQRRRHQNKCDKPEKRGRYIVLDSGRFGCPKCDKSFPQKQNVYRHTRVCGTEKALEGDKTCTTCGSIFPTPSELKVHMRSHRPKKYHIVCNKCSAVYGSLHYFKIHELKCDEVPLVSADPPSDDSLSDINICDEDPEDAGPPTIIQPPNYSVDETEGNSSERDTGL